jgi:hypothetical protein
MTQIIQGVFADAVEFDAAGWMQTLSQSKKSFIG